MGEFFPVFRNFNTLTMHGTAWNWDTNATFNNTTIQSGSLALLAILASPVYIGSAGTLTTDAGAGGTLFVTSNPYPGAMVPLTVSGVISGTGTINGNVWNDGTIHPGSGNGTGALTVTGNYENKGRDRGGRDRSARRQGNVRQPAIRRGRKSEQGTVAGGWRVCR